MSPLFDRIVIAVPNLSSAAAHYERLLGVQLQPQASDVTGPVAWLALANTILELREQPVKAAVITGFILADGTKPEASAIDNERDLAIGLCDGSATRKFRAQYDKGHQSELKVDHLVLHTADADSCIELFEARLGLRLALDKDMPQWGGRMLFFRSGKLTLEVIASQDNKPDKDFFWGIAYQCADIGLFTARLNSELVEVSSVRDGRKPGTKVATVKSHNLDIPTLLVQPAK